MNAPEVLRIAEHLERTGRPRAAAELRLAVVAEYDPERVAPVQEPSGGAVAAIPWGLHELLHRAYGHDQTAERMAERGGFGRHELGLLAVGMYGWRAGTQPRADGGFGRSYPLLELYTAARGAGVVP